MKNLFFLLLLPFFAQAQDVYNPFEAIHKNSQTISLSQGKFEELYADATYKRIGDVIFNTKTNKVEKILEPDDSTTLRQNDQSTRWLSLDPLASKYPSLSPYNFVNNNPIIYVDPDGRAYGVYINHRTRTIIIKATFYTAMFYNKRMGSTSELTYNESKKAAQFYNGITGTFVLQDGITYNIYFNIQVISTGAQFFNTASSDNEGNSVKTLDQLNLNSKAVTPLRPGTNIVGLNTGSKNIEIATVRDPSITNYEVGPDIESNFVMQNRQNRPADLTYIHEFGHSFLSDNPTVNNMFHNQPNTFMSSDENIPNNPVSYNVPFGFLNQILGQAGIGTASQPSNIIPVIDEEDPKNRPSCFDSGTVNQ